MLRSVFDWLVGSGHSFLTLSIGPIRHEERLGFIPSEITGPKRGILAFEIVRVIDSRDIQTKDKEAPEHVCR